MKKYLEKYVLGMVTVLIAIVVSEGPNIRIADMTWKHVIAGIIILPSFLYFMERVNDDFSEPYFTWQRFWLFLSLIIGAISTFIAAILLGFFQ